MTTLVTGDEGDGLMFSDHGIWHKEEDNNKKWQMVNPTLHSPYQQQQFCQEFFARVIFQFQKSPSSKKVLQIL